MQSNFGQPRREFRLSGELMKAGVGANIRILDDVLRFIVVPKNGPDNPEQALIVAAHQDFVKRSLACLDPCDDMLI